MPTQVQGLGLVDDQGNKSIVVNLSNARQMTNAEYQQLTPAQRNGAIIVTDYPIPEDDDTVSVTADGVKTYGQLLNELFALIDLSKVDENTTLQFLSGILSVQAVNANSIYLTQSVFVGGNMEMTTVFLTSGASTYKYVRYNGSTFTPTDAGINIPSNGTKITLYYGTSSEIINVLTDADHCMMSDGVTSVEDALDDKLSLSKTSSQTVHGGVKIDRQNGTTSTIGSSAIQIGNNIPSGKEGNSRGYVELYGTGSYFARLRAGDITEQRNIDLPDKSGTIALTSDLAPKEGYHVGVIRKMSSNDYALVVFLSDWIISNYTITAGTVDINYVISEASTSCTKYGKNCVAVRSEHINEANKDVFTQVYLSFTAI